MSTEAGKFYSIGTSHRPEPHTAFGAPKNVGPGSYEVLGSANHLKSPLDGSEFCHTTMKMKSKFGWKTTGCSPGPVYILKPTVGPHVTPTYRLERMKHGERHDFMHDRNPDVGPGTYNIQDLLMGSTMLRSASSPHLSGASGGGEKTAFPETLAGGSKRLVKSTFGVASRFDSKVGGLAGAGSSSPTGSLYYAHNSNVDTTRGQGPAPGLGSGQKTDFTRPYGGHHSGVSPVTYSPVASICKKTSSLDGFLHRGLSPQKAQAAARGD
jgi:hypothetical protein